MSAEHKAALVLSGGGARGAYQVGVLKAVAEDVPSGTNPFRVLTGLSVGAINAAVLAEGADDFPGAVRKLEALWRSLHCASVYRTDWGSLVGRLARWAGALTLGWAGAKPPPSLLDAEPLARLLARRVDFGRVNAMAEGGAFDALALTASSYSSGKAVTFFAGAFAEDWRRARRTGRRCRIGPEHVLASAALPVVFPAVQIEGEWFGDGALRQVAPLSPAIHLGCDRLFLIGARDKDTGPDVAPAPSPSLGVIGGQLLDIVFNDQMDADIERSARINRTLDAMLPERRAATQLRPIAIERINPSRDVRLLAGEHVSALPPTVKLLLRAVGAYRPPWVLPSYLTFEPGLIAALIDLGYADGRARAGRTRAFLGLGEAQPKLAAPDLVVDD
ncbi:patatin-like phospholipase family protein [Parvularcula dongshanensis]|uniref:NTE family protein n=1 Tax=Parvularcula dongshanensis TaxID=1173995 RepID=A0A840I5Z0_9PROT|nr:patatin-like phospholipase family protein [Parvularcula dongshanensis]MBB4659430.1 NTE family protein [Parvularcula dongshanensis]